MLITTSSYQVDPGSLHPHSTMLRFNNIVSNVEDAEIVVFLSYQFRDDESIDKLVRSFKEYKHQTVLLDFTCEIFSGALHRRMLLEESLENVMILTNGLPNDIRDFIQLKKKGCDVEITPFFLKYIHYYFPLRVKPNDQTITNRKFLLMVGKLKVERTALIGLLRYHGILSQGHVSYFRERNFSPEATEEYYDSDAPFKQKQIVKQGLDHIGSDLYLDVFELDYDTSHGRQYNSDYYHACDFVVVCESDAARGILFITEKIGKCIQLNKKFILLGSKGLLSYTKEQCKIHLNRDISHLTDWCDTSYDEIDNVWERVEKIVEIIRDVE